MPSSCSSGDRTWSTAIDHWGDRFVMHTNDDAVDFRVLTAPVEADLTRPASWTELVAHIPGRRIVSAEAFATHLVIHEWADAQPRLRILFRDGSERVVDLGDDPHDVEPASNPQWDTNLLRFTIQSLTMPTTLYDEDVTTGERTLLRRIPTPRRRPRPLSNPPALGDLCGRDPGAARHRPPRRHATRRHRARRALRLRRLRGIDAAVVLRGPPVAARSRIRLGARPPAWRRRTRSPVVPRRQAARQAAHVRRHDRLRRAPRLRAASSPPTASRSAADQPAASSWRRA